MPGEESKQLKASLYGLKLQNQLLLPQIAASTKASGQKSELREDLNFSAYSNYKEESNLAFEGGEEKLSRSSKRTPSNQKAKKINDMESQIKEKFAIAQSNKNAKKEFIGINGDTNPDNVLSKMVDKLV